MDCGINPEFLSAVVNAGVNSASVTIVFANLSVSNPVILAILVISLSAYARYAANCSGLSDSRVIPFEAKALCTVASLTASRVVFISGLLAGPFCPLRRKSAATFSGLVPVNAA